MKKNVIVCGLIAGLIVSTIMAISMVIYSKVDVSGSMLIGYASMLLAFSMIYVGIKNQRDKYQDGVITFGKAFMVGLYIALIGSTLYVLTWMVEFYVFIPDYMENYAARTMEAARESGMSQVDLDAQAAELESYKEIYKNPLLVFLFTYVEILPVGILVSLICAAILKRKSPKADPTQVEAA